MRIHLSVSGGFANVQLSGEIDSNELSDDIIRQLESLASHGASRRPDGHPGAADMRQFVLSVDDKTINVDEGGASPEDLQLCNQLFAILVRTKREAQE